MLNKIGVSKYLVNSPLKPLLRQMVHVLLIEDESNLGRTLEDRLKLEGFQVSWVQDLKSAFILKQEFHFDLVLLDLGLPGDLGWAWLERVEEKKIPVLVLTARGEPEDRIRGLELGAEDYIVKPFHFRELVLRMRKAIGTQVRPLDQGIANEDINKEMEPIIIGQAKVYFSRFSLEVAGKVFSLTQKELRLLHLLWNRKGLVVSRDEILDQIWSKNEFPTPRTVDNFILRIRKWIEKNPESPELIKSIRGIGYQLLC